MGAVQLRPVAISYSAGSPDRVSALILWTTYSRGAELAVTGPAMLALLDENWETFTQVVTHQGFGWEAGESAVRGAAVLREAVNPAVMRAAIHATVGWDVADLLSQVRCPTLVLHRRETTMVPLDSAKALAAGLPNSQLALLEGSSGAPQVDTGPVLREIDAFLGIGTGPSEGDETRHNMPQGTAVILFADIVDSTALTEQMGDAAFRERARVLDGSLREIIRKAGGTPIEGKLLGDGVLATFASARQAIEAALACGKAGDDDGLPLHLGLHAGDVISEEGNVFGGAVNVAARISGESAAGELLVSQTVRDLARTSTGPSVEGFEDCGERELKGVGEPVRVWRVRAG